MAIVKTDVPMTSALCSQTIDDIVAEYPFCRSEILTQTAFERPVKTLVIGQGPRNVLFSAAHHANEWITTPVLLKFVEELAEAIRSGGQIWGVDGKIIDSNCTIHTVPMVNPDRSHRARQPAVCGSRSAGGLLSQHSLPQRLESQPAGGGSEPAVPRRVVKSQRDQIQPGL